MYNLICKRLILVTLLGAFLVINTTVEAAKLVPEDLENASPDTDHDNPQTKMLISRIQAALGSLGLYKGPVTGVMNDQTDAAIRRYQKSKQLTETGIADDAMARELETTVNVNNLLTRLEKVRKEGKKAARDALLNNPETRDLVENNAADAVADPTRDTAACFSDPTVQCLLREALENAKTVPRDNMRNWAYSDILVSQARAGLTAAARDTVRHISDPRMILQALGKIAASEALSGNAENAIAAVEGIPDQAVRLETYANMVLTMAEGGHDDGVLHLVDHLRNLTHNIEFTVKVSSHLAKASQSLFFVNERDMALILLEEIKEKANSPNLTPDHRNTSLRHVADTLASAGYVEEAVKLLERISDTDERLPVLMSAARAEALDGEPEAALVMAGAIDALRYRALVLATIAEGYARTGDDEYARLMLTESRRATENISLPFARDYARSRLALAKVAASNYLGDDDGAMYEDSKILALSIEDPRLAAYTIWKLMFLKYGSSNDIPEDEISIALASTERILSPSGRVWLLAELVEEQIHLGYTKSAWDVFNRAMLRAVSITNAWGKSRALSRLALSLIHLQEQSTDASKTKP